MNIVKRSNPRFSSRIAVAAAVLLPLGVIALGIAAWRDAGVQPVESQTIAVPLPELSK